jgi:hypothetical protein
MPLPLEVICSNAVSSSLETSEPSCEDAMAHAQKRARIEISSFEDLKLEDISLKAVGKSKKDQRIYVNIGENPIRANLTPKDWVSTRFGFDLSGRFEKPSFLGGMAPERKGCPESLGLRVTLNTAQVEFMQKLDEAAQAGMVDIAPAKWNPLLGLGSDQCKFSVVLAGDGMTKLTVVKDGVISRGEGFEFLNSFGTSFSQSDVKLVFRVRRVWQHTGKAGLSLEATQLVLRTTVRPQEDNAFADESELLA